MEGQRKARLEPKRITAERLEKSALRYLERFATSSANLRRVLMRRVEVSAAFHDEDPARGAALVEALIARYLSAGLLNDENFAAARAASLHRRGISRVGIRGRLAQKGLDGDQVAKALDDLGEEPGGSEFAAACALARRRRIGPYRLKDREENRRKDLGTFARAGFGSDVTRRVLEAADVEALEALLREEDA